MWRTFKRLKCKMPHWHNHNPWFKHVIYITLEEWADCHAGLNEYCDCTGVGGGPHEQMTHEWIMRHALHNPSIRQGTPNPKVDPYILPQPSGHHSLGLRFGPKDRDYESPACNHKKAQKLIEKYRPEGIPK